MQRIPSLLLGAILFMTACSHKSVTIIKPKNTNSRLNFGIEWLIKSLQNANYEVTVADDSFASNNGRTIIIGMLSDPLIKKALGENGIVLDSIPDPEGFAIRTVNNTTIIGGADSSGTLYGALEIHDMIDRDQTLPASINQTDQPEMTLRGTCIGLQKPTLLPGRGVYEYPITEENFPWFYNKKLWIEYLDMLAENRYNSLYLWNGHPFASLVRLKDYPYAVEVDSATFRKNEEMYRFLTREANKRGIWVIQMFYNIIVSKPFAEHNHIKTQDRDRPIKPLIADYTRKSIAAFVEKYPNVGLLVCLGEAMQGLDTDIEWFTKTIIPGVRDGLEALGRTDEPPIVLRGHDTDAPAVMKASLPLYKNLYTMEKYTGESLTTYRPRGRWAEVHRTLSDLASTNIENVHILANLEPFRYGSPDFIQKSVKAMHRVHHDNGLHLYPQASYWNWPYTADKAAPRLLEMNRDWIWYRAWARYAWEANRSRDSEISYWTDQLDDTYGAGKYSRDILNAYEQSGEISPMIIRRFGITEGNRQTMSLGMFMSQLVNPERWGLFKMLYTSDGPPGELLTEYVKKEYQGEPHIGETPPWAIKQIVAYADSAVNSIEQAAPYVTRNRDEYERLKNDMYCYQAMANFYNQKVKAAMKVLRYKYSGDIRDLEDAETYLAQSVDYYKRLVDLTQGAYLYANSMQTAQRTIPISGRNQSNKTWAELLPHYEQELQSFRENVKLLKTTGTEAARQVDVQSLKPVSVQILSSGVQRFNIGEGQKPFLDKNYQIENIAEELQGLQGLRFSMGEQADDGTQFRFKNEHPVKVIVGFFNTDDKDFLSPSALETNANANNKGQADIKLLNAVGIPGLPPVNIHTYYFDAGENILHLDDGVCLILGFIDGTQEINRRDAGFTGSTREANGVDWLFY